ncbi:hypothetical protein ES708_13626 [subsurface metagenome]
MGEIDEKGYYHIIHYYGLTSFTDGSYFLYGYKEGECLTGNVIVKELSKDAIN